MNQLQTWIAILLVSACLAGCGPTTRVYFREPAETTMEIGASSYTWPAEVEFRRPASMPDTNSYELSLTVPTEQEPLRLRGEIQVHAFYSHDVDTYARTECRISKEALRELRNGAAVEITGFSAGNRQVVYKLILGPE